MLSLPLLSIERGQEIVPLVFVSLHSELDHLSLKFLGGQEHLVDARFFRKRLHLLELSVLGQNRVNLLDELFVPFDKVSIGDSVLFQLQLQDVVVLFLGLNNLFLVGDLGDVVLCVFFLRPQLLFQGRELEPERSDILAGLVRAKRIVSLVLARRKPSPSRGLGVAHVVCTVDWLLARRRLRDFLVEGGLPL